MSDTTLARRRILDYIDLARADLQRAEQQLADFDALERLPTAKMFERPAKGLSGTYRRLPSGQWQTQKEDGSWVDSHLTDDGVRQAWMLVPHRQRHNLVTAAAWREQQKEEATAVIERQLHIANGRSR
jgi:hypothetical protein